MTAPLSSLTFVRLVAGPDTQSGDVQYDGRIVGFPAGSQDIGSGPDSPGRLFGINGYPQPSAAGTGVTVDFVMQGPLPPAVVEAIRQIPDRGWVDTTARQQVRQQVRRLIVAGLPAADAVDVANIIHDAGVTNERALP